MLCLQFLMCKLKDQHSCKNHGSNATKTSQIFLSVVQICKTEEICTLLTDIYTSQCKSTYCNLSHSCKIYMYGEMLQVWGRNEYSTTITKTSPVSWYELVENTVTNRYEMQKISIYHWSCDKQIFYFTSLTPQWLTRKW